MRCHDVVHWVQLVEKQQNYRATLKLRPHVCPSIQRTTRSKTHFKYGKACSTAGERLLPVQRFNSEILWSAVVLENL